MVNPIIEVCANSAQSCVNAELGGAYRVELCAGIPEGGTTPSRGEILAARQAAKLKINVIIRPRSGDFLYSPLEIKAMEWDIQTARDAGADGVVFGCLTSNGDVDMTINERLMRLCSRMSVTFHRAFDVCRDPSIALEQLISLGFDRILTSGQEATAVKGVDLIVKLVKQAQGKIIIMPGCGVNESNIADLALATSATEFHMSARHRITSGMAYHNDRVSMGGSVTIEEFSNEVTAAERVKASIEALRNV